MAKLNKLNVNMNQMYIFNHFKKNLDWIEQKYNEYQDKIEYKKLTLTCDMISLTRRIFLKLKN